MRFFSADGPPTGRPVGMAKGFPDGSAIRSKPSSLSFLVLPKAAFEVADSLGFYLQIELPMWSLQVGEDPKANQFIWDEANRISREYSNHPSFCFWSMGNELEGRFDYLARLMTHLKQQDKRHLYTTTTYSFQSLYVAWAEAADDFFVTQQTKLGLVRGQGIFNQQAPAFLVDYSASLVGLTVPLVTHEMGQYAPSRTWVRKTFRQPLNWPTSQQMP